VDSNPKRWTPQDAKGFAQQTASEAQTPPEKRPLYRTLSLSPSFPVEALRLPFNE
jgi:hypothetical protein